MCSGLPDDPQQVNDARKAAIIARELAELNIDIAAIQKTRLASCGCRKEDYTFFWQGMESDERRIYGVDFAVRKSILLSVETPSQWTEGILSLRLNTTSGPTHILSDYAPTLCSIAEAKDAFHEEHETRIRAITDKEHLFLFGDFNSWVGADHTSWPRCIGICKLNENGQRLPELCSFNDLAITNTFYPNKPHHRVSWRQPRSKHWYQLNFVNTRRTVLNHVLCTRSYHSADCDIDLFLVVSMVRLRPRWIHRSQQKGRPRIDTAGTSKPELRKRFADAIDKTLKNCPIDSATARCDFIRDDIY